MESDFIDDPCMPLSPSPINADLIAPSIDIKVALASFIPSAEIVSVR